MNNLDKEIHDTYYSKKNKDILPIVIFFSVVFLIFNGAIIFESLLWLWYYTYCSNNNQKLRNDKVNIKKQEHLIKVKEHIKKEGK